MSQNFNPSDALSWSQFVTNFDASIAQFDDLLNQLISIGPNVPAESAMDYEQLVNEMTSDQETFHELQALRDDAASWLATVGTAYGQYGTQVFTSGGLSGLGQISRVAWRVGEALAAIVALDYLIERAKAYLSGQPIQPGILQGVANVLNQPWALIALAVAAIYVVPALTKK